MPSLRQIVYVSSALAKLDKDELEDLVAQSRKRNDAVNVTGLLVYSDGNFMQAIEGGHDEVEQLYNRIADDPRHRDLMVIVDHSVEDRSFPSWRMAYAYEPDPENMARCVHFLRSHESLYD